MERAEKRELVASLQSALSGAGSIVVAQNAGLTVADLETLRRQMKQAGGYGQGRQEPPCQACSERHRQCRHLGPVHRPDRHRLRQGPHDCAEDRGSIRRQEPEVRGSRWRHGQDRARRRTTSRRWRPCRRWINCAPRSPGCSSSPRRVSRRSCRRRLAVSRACWPLMRKRATKQRNPSAPSGASTVRTEHVTKRDVSNG